MKKCLSIALSVLTLLLVVMQCPVNAARNDGNYGLEQQLQSDENYKGFMKKFGKFDHVVISAPIDKRPISNDYMKNIIELGGDTYINADEAFLDKGPSAPNVNDWIPGDSQGLRNDILNKVSQNNKPNTTVIINTSSYIFGGLVCTRQPDKYMNNAVANAIADIDQMTSQYKHPRYYFHIMMPRVIPETRGFDYKTTYKDNGLTYYYNLHNNITPNTTKTTFNNLLIEYGYVKSKKDSGRDLKAWEQDFLTYFEATYITNATDNFKYENVPIATLYEQIFKETGELIKRMMDRVKNKSIDEIVISMDDYVLPTFITNKKNEDWVDKDEIGNPVKYSFGKKYVLDAMAYQDLIFGESSSSYSLKGQDKNINYIFGTDEIPQMIYSRDLTRRRGYVTDFEVDYSNDIDPVKSKNHIGTYEATTVENLIDQRISFVTCKLKNGYVHGIKKSKHAKKFVLFVHNSDMLMENGKKYTYTLEEAANFTQSVYNEYNKGSNVGVLDLATNMVDWNLFAALSSVEGNGVNQFGCYSGFNTIGNSTGLGIAHAQVFGIIDFWGGLYKDIDSRRNAHCRVLAQHLLEDAIYNTKIKQEQPNTYDFINTNLNTILNSTLDYDANKKPGGVYWVMSKFTKYPMVLNNREYIWSSSSVQGNLPLFRNFECRINTDFIK